MVRVLTERQNFNSSFVPIGDQMEMNFANVLYCTSMLILGVTCNVFILVIYQKSQRKTKSERSSDSIVRCLAVADVMIAASIVTHFLNLKNNTGLCRLELFVKVFPLSMSMYLLACVAIERYLAVCRPLVKCPSSKFLIMATVALSMVVSLLFVLMHKVVAKELCIFTNITSLRAFILTLSIVYYVLLAALLIVLYSLVFRAIYCRNGFRTFVPRDVTTKATSEEENLTIKPRQSKNVKFNCKIIYKKYKDRVTTSASQDQYTLSTFSKNTACKKSKTPVVESSLSPSGKDALATDTESSVRASTSFLADEQMIGSVATIKQRQKDSLQLRTAIMFSLITVLFLLVWLPHWIANIDRVFNNRLHIPYILYHFYLTNALLHPILYGMFDRRVREYLSGIIGNLQE